MTDLPNQLARLQIMWNCATCRPKVEAGCIKVERERLPDDLVLNIPACEACEALFAQLKRAM